jgi:hypothetical protein
MKDQLVFLLRANVRVILDYWVSGSGCEEGKEGVGAMDMSKGRVWRLTWCFWRTWDSLLDTSIRLMAEIESCRRQRKRGACALSS